MATGGVWVRAPDGADEVYLLGTVVGEPEAGQVTVKLPDGKEQSLHTSDIFSANPDGFVAPDNTMLIHLSEATLLANLRQRYKSKDIYTLTGTILLVGARAHMHTRAHAPPRPLPPWSRWMLGALLLPRALLTPAVVRCCRR